MSGSKLIVDTNIALYFLQGEKLVAPYFAEYDIVVSFITELELLSFATISPEDEQLVTEFLKNTLIIDITSSIKSETISIRRQTKLKLPDAIIAATSIIMDIPFLTADKAFLKVDDPRIILLEL